MRLSLRFPVPAVPDVELARRVVPHLLTALRTVPVVDGVPVDARGRRCAGVTVSGVPGRPGAVYRFRLATPSADLPEPTDADEAELVGLRRRGEWDAVDRWYGRWFRPRAGDGQEVAVELRADTATELAAVVTVGATRTEIDLVRPQWVEAVVVRVSGSVKTGRRWLDGEVSGDLAVQLDRLPPKTDRRPQLVGSGRHRRVQGSVRVWLTGDADRWEGRAKVRVQGRGVLRPVVAMVGLFGRRRVEQAFTDALGDAASPTGATDQLRAVFGPDPDPVEIAGFVVERLLVISRPDR